VNNPRISIVTATYNRSNVLRYTIQSVLASTFSDWEMIVVGDACTDDTAEVVQSFGDERIRFVNLPVNAGEQSVPNNEGVRLARGEFIAFLNHDDLWTPEHLSVCLDAIAGADLVFTLGIGIDERSVAHLTGVCRSGVYEPHVPIPASTWFVRRAMIEDVGPWRPARKLWNSPSQEWLYRAWRKGHVMRSVERVTTLLLFSGGRAGSYAERQSDENARYAALLRDDPTFLPRMVQSIAAHLTAEQKGTNVTPHLIRAAKAATRRLSALAGVHPFTARHVIMFGRKGGFIDALRRTRGLPPLPRGGSS
jgi:glycosyltransferase involved in cell wall biosynthesis